MGRKQAGPDPPVSRASEREIGCSISRKVVDDILDGAGQVQRNLGKHARLLHVFPYFHFFFPLPVESLEYDSHNPG